MAPPAAPIFRVPARLREALQARTEELGLDLATHLENLILTDLETTGHLGGGERRRFEALRALSLRAADRARALREEGRFDAHFILTVMRDLLSDPEARRDYEGALNGDADAMKPRLDSTLAQEIRRAVGAEILTDNDGRPRREAAAGEVVPSYLLLRLP
jgi:hypothetical protein